MQSTPDVAAIMATFASQMTALFERQMERQSIMMEWHFSALTLEIRRSRSPSEDKGKGPADPVPTVEPVLTVDTAPPADPVTAETPSSTDSGASPPRQWKPQKIDFLWLPLARSVE